jgi:hypothetical protein
MRTLLKTLAFLACAVLVGIVATLAPSGNFLLANAIAESADEDEE